MNLEDLRVGDKVKIKQSVLNGFDEPWCNLPIVTILEIDAQYREFRIEEEITETYNFDEIEKIVNEKVNIDRFNYVKTDEAQISDMENIRKAVKHLSYIIELYAKDGRGKDIALMKLEECQYWANKSICGSDK